MSSTTESNLKIQKIDKYTKLGLKIMENQALLSAVKRWGYVR